MKTEIEALKELATAPHEKRTDPVEISVVTEHPDVNSIIIKGIPKSDMLCILGNEVTWRLNDIGISSTKYRTDIMGSICILTFVKSVDIAKAEDCIRTYVR